jgi:hypothetical protein
MINVGIYGDEQRDTYREAKKTISATLVLFILLFSLFSCTFIAFPVKADTYDWVIDGDTVYVDHPHFYLGATPHTLSSSGWVEFNVMLKTTSTDIDFAWGFNSLNGIPSKPQFWKSYEHSETDFRWVEKEQSVTVYEVVSYTNLGIDDYDNHTVTFGNRNNNYLFEVTFNGENGQYTKVYAFSSYEVNGNVYILTGNNDVWEKYTKVSTYEDWWNIPASFFESKNWNFQGMDTWYLALDNTLQEDKMYRIRVWVDVPFGGLEGTEGKYFWAVKPSALSLQQALDQNKLYYIDPWYSSYWLYRKPFWVNSSMVEADESDEHPFLIHIEADDDLANKTYFGGRDIVITDNDSNILPFEIEYFNQLTGEFIAWVNASYSSVEDTQFYIYYGNPNSQRLENIDDTWTDRHAGIWHLSEQSNEWEYDPSFSFSPVITNITGANNNYVVGYSQGSGKDGYARTFSLVKGTFSQLDSQQLTTTEREDLDIMFINDTNILVGVASGVGDDGDMKTLEVQSDGTIVTPYIDEWEFDTDFCAEPKIFNINNNTFGVAYSTSGNDGMLKTVNISNDGTIGTEIDQWEFDTDNGQTIDVIRLNDTNMFAFVYAGYQDDGYIKTIEISDDGAITKSAYDTHEFDIVQGYGPSTVHVASDIYAIAYTGAGDDGYLKTIPINEDGTIGAEIDSFEFDTETATHCSLLYSYNNIYVIAYGESPEGYVITVQILDDGEITQFVIDEYVFNTNKAEDTILSRIPYQTYPPIQFMTAYRGESDAGFITTFGVTEDGYIYVLFRDSTINDNWGVGGEGNLDYMPTGADGVVYLGQRFDGVDDYIDVEDDPSLYGNNIGTVDLWFKLDEIHDSTDNAKRLIGRHNHLGTNGQFLMELHSDGTLRARLYDGSFHTVSSSKNSWDADIWYYVALAWDTSPTGYGMKLYWNLVNDGNNTDNNYAPNDAGDIHIGLYIDADKDAFEGVIDEVRVHKHGIDLDFMQTNYNMITYQGIGDGKFIYMGAEEYWFDFLEPPFNLTANTYNSTRIDLLWDKAQRMDNAYIRYSNITYPINRWDGTFCCNITGSSFQLDGLEPYTTYYFSAWGYNATNNTWTTNYSIAYNTTLPVDQPDPPSDLIAETLDQSRIRLTWGKPFQVDYVYIRYDPTTYPTTMSEGNFSVNSSGTSFIQTGLDDQTTYYFSAWSYNTTSGFWSLTYSFAYNTTFSELFYFSNENPANGSTDVEPFPTLCITVNSTYGTNFNLTWYFAPELSSIQAIYNSTNLANGTYCIDLSTFNESTYGYYGWEYDWYLVATQYHGSGETTSDTYLYETEGYVYTLEEDVSMSTWLILLWIAIWAILMGINIKAKSTSFGMFAGFWLFMLGLAIIVTGVQIETGTITTTVNPGQFVEQIQWTDVVYPFSTYSIVWGIFLFALAVYIVSANVIARQSKA